MLQIEIDGKQVSVEQGATVIEAAHKLGTYIPHFCYHKKLSIAANCRMCLVDVEKAPKPLPACATPVTDGMIVRTHSAKAREAQEGVMEFLLINIRSTVRPATKAANASCRIWRWATAKPPAAIPKKNVPSSAKTWGLWFPPRK